MGTAKLKVDFATGMLDVEAEEEFVTRIYEDFKSRFHDAQVTQTPQRQPTSKLPTHADQATAWASKARGASRKESFSIVKDLDLSAKANQVSLRDFYKQKAPTSVMECNVVFEYYLKKIANVPQVGPAHFYTCYKDVGARVPTALRQSLKDASSRRGFLDTSSLDDVKLTTQGENFVEHDLPKAQKPATE